MDFYDLLLAGEINGSGGGGGSALQYGSPFVLVSGACNYFNNTLWLDYAISSNNTRRSLWGKDGNATVMNYNATNPDYHSVNPNIKLTKIPSGSTKVKVVCDYTCQIYFRTFSVSGTSVTAQIDDSGWVNITANEWLTYNISSSDELGISFRRDSNNTAWVSTTSSGTTKAIGGNDCIYNVQIEFE